MPRKTSEVRSQPIERMREGYARELERNRRRARIVHRKRHPARKLREAN